MKFNKLLKTGLSLIVILFVVGGQGRVFASDEPTLEPTPPSVQVLQKRAAGGDVQIIRIAVQQSSFAPVANLRKPDNRLDLQVVSRGGSVVLIGRRLVNVNRGPSRQTIFEEVSVRIPHYRFSMGWDVKALERELERLGIKVKPPLGVPQPRPAPPVSGGA